jgi:hypothetical protein
MVHTCVVSDDDTRLLGVSIESPGGQVYETTLEDVVRAREEQASPEGRRRFREEWEAQRVATLRASVVPLSVGGYRGHGRELTVRAAAVELVERWLGRIEVRDGALALWSPTPTPDMFGVPVRELLDVLVAAERLIVESVKKPGPVDVAKLPDVLVSPWGTPL